MVTQSTDAATPGTYKGTSICIKGLQTDGDIRDFHHVILRGFVRRHYKLLRLSYNISLIRATMAAPIVVLELFQRVAVPALLPSFKRRPLPIMARAAVFTLSVAIVFARPFLALEVASRVLQPYLIGEFHAHDH